MGDQLRSSNADRKSSDLFGPINVGSLVSAVVHAESHVPGIAGRGTRDQARRNDDLRFENS
jgi:hypothetical protein